MPYYLVKAAGCDLVQGKAWVTQLAAIPKV
jgi:hypothetical protein